MAHISPHVCGCLKKASKFVHISRFLRLWLLEKGLKILFTSPLLYACNWLKKVSKYGSRLRKA
jgi:hypothetical protein